MDATITPEKWAALCAREIPWRVYKGNTRIAYRGIVRDALDDAARWETRLYLCEIDAETAGFRLGNRHRHPSRVRVRVESYLVDERP